MTVQEVQASAVLPTATVPKGVWSCAPEFRSNTTGSIRSQSCCLSCERHRCTIRETLPHRSRPARAHCPSQSDHFAFVRANRAKACKSRWARSAPEKKKGLLQEVSARRSSSSYRKRGMECAAASSKKIQDFQESSSSKCAQRICNGQAEASDGPPESRRFHSAVIVRGD